MRVSFTRVWYCFLPPHHVVCSSTTTMCRHVTACVTSVLLTLASVLTRLPRRSVGAALVAVIPEALGVGARLVDPWQGVAKLRVEPGTANPKRHRVSSAHHGRLSDDPMVPYF